MVEAACIAATSVIVSALFKTSWTEYDAVMSALSEKDSGFSTSPQTVNPKKWFSNQEWFDSSNRHHLSVR